MPADGTPPIRFHMLSGVAKLHFQKVVMVQEKCQVWPLLPFFEARKDFAQRKAFACQASSSPLTARSSRGSIDLNVCLVKAIPFRKDFLD